MKLPSLQHETSLVWSGDPALDSPVKRDGESKEDWESRLKDWDEKLQRARKTGQWDGLLKAGQKATLFNVGYVPKKPWSKFEDEVRSDAIGVGEAMVLAFQLAIRSATELEGKDGKPFKVTHKHDSAYGEVAREDILDLLDAYYRARKADVPDVSDPVMELGAAVIARQRGVDPLSSSA